MKIVVSALHFAWNDIEDCLSTATGELGLDGVELSWHESFQRPHCTAADIDVLASMRDSNPAALSAHIWDNIAETDPAQAAASLMRWLHLCEKTGASNLIIHGGSYAQQREGISRTRSVLESVLPEFERAGVVLNLENHYDYQYRNCRELFSRPWEFKDVFSLDSSSLRFCFDTGHGNMTGNTAELLGKLAPWLNYVHLADNHGIDDDHAAYGEGTVAWREVFSTLHGIGFDNIFCVEFPVRDNRDPFRLCCEEMRRRWGG